MNGLCVIHMDHLYILLFKKTCISYYLKKRGIYMLLIKDLIHNEFDLNCRYNIYDCKNDKSWHEAEILYDSETDEYSKPLNEILNMHVKYITVSNNKLIIEANDD